MISLDATQALYATKARLQLVSLVRIRTYSNVLTGTVSETFYLASLPVRYEWTAGTPVQFEPLIRSVSPVVRGFPHLPDGFSAPTRDGIRIQLDARVRGGSSLWTRMQARQLIGARVDLASLILPPANAGQSFDFSSMGSVHTIRWRGEVVEVSELDWDAGEFSLACDVVRPALDWPFAGDSTVNDPRDSGKRYPLPVGTTRGVELVGREVGWSTTLVSAMAATGTANTKQTDGSGFPQSGAFLVRIGDEVLSIDGAASSNTNLVILARAQSGTTAAEHPIGATVTEYVREARFVLSAREMKAPSSLYWQLPNGQRIRLEVDTYGWNPGSDAVESGQRLGVVSFDREQLAAAIDVVAAVTQQAEYELGENSIVRLAFTGQGVGNAAATGGTGALNSDFATSGSPTGLLGTYTAAAVDYGSAWTIDTGFGSQEVIRFRPVIDNELTSDGSIPTQLRYNVPSITISGSTITSSGPQTVRNYNGGAANRQLTPGAWITPTVAGVWTVADLVGSGIGSGVRCLFHLRQDTAPAGGPGTSALVYTPSSYWEVEVAPPPVVRTLPVDVVAGWAVGFGLRLVADCQGIVERSGEAVVSALDFSTTTGWSAVNCSISVQTVLSRQCIRLDNATDELVDLRFVGLAADWSASGGAVSFECFISSVDKDRLEGSAGKAVELRLESLGGETKYRFGPADLVDDQWTTLVVDLAAHPNRVTTGSGATLSAVANIRLGAEWRAGTIPPASTPDIFFRNVRFMTRALVEHPIDVGAFVIEDLAGQAGAVDSSAAATAKTNLPGVKMSTDIRRFGESMGDLLARLEFEGRTNWVPTEAAAGTLWRPFAALSSYAWPAAVRTLTSFRSLGVATRQLDELASEFSALYDYRPDQQTVDIEAYRAVLRADSGRNDISADVSSASLTAARELVGVRPTAIQEFIGLADSASAIEVWAYYVKEALRFGGRRFSMVVDYAQGADLEPGDIVEFVAPWDGSTIKGRITRTAVPLDAPGVGLSIEEVP